MDIGNYDIEKILKAMYDMAKKCVTMVYTSRPQTTPDNIDSFMIVSLPNDIENDLALGFTTAKFQFFVRDKDNDIENLDTASNIQRLMIAQLPCEIENKWQFSVPIFQTLGSDGKGFHAYKITTTLTIL
jgi:hypothetical protein